MGFETFFDKSFASHVDLAKIAEAEERALYIAEWSQPGRADRDAQLVSRLASSSSRRRA